MQIKQLIEALPTTELIDQYYYEDLFKKIKDTQFDSLFDFLKSEDSFIKENLRNEIDRLNKLKSLGSSKTISFKEIPKVEWTIEDVSNLSKAVVKFPAGVKERWIRIAEFLHGKFSEDEVVAKAKDLKSKHKNELEIKFVEKKIEKIETPIEKIEPSKPSITQQSNPANWTAEQ